MKKGEVSLLENMKKIHFVGIGGAGMSAIAKILVEKNFEVSGSDLHGSELVEKLRSQGAKIVQGHCGENVTGKDAIVVSTAISSDNPEVVAATAKGIKIFHRSDIVAALMNAKDGIAVAGAHGKTTTTSMLGVVLDHAGVEPTIIIGGEVDYLGSNAKLGKGPYLVAEADESDGSFLKLLPKIAVVTNIENDHMDHYGTMENILKAFKQFLQNLPAEDGLAVVCFENENIRRIMPESGRKYISYAIETPADYQAAAIETNGEGTTFEVLYRGENIGRISLRVPGRHNVLNALAATAVGRHLGLSIDAIAEGFKHFNGAKRRFQTKGRMEGIWIVDDYAHHPTEISTTLTAAKQTGPKRVICAFQPHRYTRTQLLRKEYGACFKEADVLVLTDIYSAGETPIPGITGRTIVEEVAAQTGQQVVYVENESDVAACLADLAEAGDIVLTMGAGTIYRAGEQLVDLLEKKARANKEA